MGILDELASATGDKSSNEEVVDRCLATPALLHSIAEGLRTGTPQASADCAQILVDVAKKRSDLLADFVTDFVDATRTKSKKVAKLGYTGLALVVPSQPAEVFAHRDYLLQTARGGGTLGLAAASVISALCSHSANYRGKLIAHTVRLLHNVPDKELPRWISAIAPAAHGSPDAVKRLERFVEPRLAALPDTSRKRIDKTLAQLQRSARRR